MTAADFLFTGGMSGDIRITVERYGWKYITAGQEIQPQDIANSTISPSLLSLLSGIIEVNILHPRLPSTLPPMDEPLDLVCSQNAEGRNSTSALVTIACGSVNSAGFCSSSKATGNDHLWHKCLHPAV